MRLTYTQSLEWKERALDLHKAAFTGVELAPSGMFLNKWAIDQPFVAEGFGILRGYAIVVGTQGPYPFLWELAVNPRFRRQGVGSRLIDEVMAWVAAENDYGLELTVNANNAGAIALYERKEFKTVRRLKNYYFSGDGLLMRREI